MPKLPPLTDIIKILGIDKPILDVTSSREGELTIYLYGGEVMHWPPAAVIQVEPSLSYEEELHFVKMPLSQLRMYAEAWHVKNYRQIKRADLVQILTAIHKEKKSNAR